MRIVYVGTSKLGMWDFLKSLPCEIVHASLADEKPVPYPDYDLGISFLYSHRIPAKEFDAGHAWVNFHPAPLPEFKGRNVAYHAIMQGATEFGGTMHYMDKDFDTGRIIEVLKFPVEQHHTAGDLVEGSHLCLVELFKKYIPLLVAGFNLESVPQTGGTYYKKQPIDPYVPLNEDQERLVRALTAHPYVPLVNVCGKNYRIVPDDTPI